MRVLQWGLVIWQVFIVALGIFKHHQLGPKPLTSSILAQQEKRKIIAFYGSSTGFNLDMNASTTKVLYEYNTIPIGPTHHESSGTSLKASIKFMKM